MLHASRFESPRSVRHLNAAARRSSGASSSGSEGGADSIPVNTANPAEIRTDGAGTVYKGERDSFVIEIIDPGQRATAPATSLQDLGADSLLDVLLGDAEAGADAPSLGGKTEPKRRQTQTQRGLNNANARRARAFRAGLVRAVALVHQRFLQDVAQQHGSGAAATTAEEDAGAHEAGGRNLRARSSYVVQTVQTAPPTTNRRAQIGKSSRSSEERLQWDPLVEGDWQPDFPVQTLELSTLRDVVKEHEAEKKGSGIASDEEEALAGGNILHQHCTYLAHCPLSSIFALLLNMLL